MKQIRLPKVQMIWSTPDPRRVIAIAARMTYSAKAVENLAQDLQEPEIAKSVAAILERRHYSVLRHVVFMFSVSGVSRAFSHQLVRHTAGHAYEQRSQHYRTEKDFNVIVPDLDDTNEQRYMFLMNMAQDFYDQAVADGNRKDDARFGLPNGVETQLVWTANLDGLMNFIKARACRVNTPEIMSVAIKVRQLVTKLIPEAAPYMGPTCMTQGMCFEGDKYYKECNRPWKSPSVLWRPDFPRTIELIGIGGRISKLQPFGIQGKIIAEDDLNKENNDET